MRLTGKGNLTFLIKFYLIYLFKFALDQNKYTKKIVRLFFIHEPSNPYTMSSIFTIFSPKQAVIVKKSRLYALSKYERY